MAAIVVVVVVVVVVVGVVNGVAVVDGAEVVAVELGSVGVGNAAVIVVVVVVVVVGGVVVVVVDGVKFLPLGRAGSGTRRRA